MFVIAAHWPTGTGDGCGAIRPSDMESAAYMFKVRSLNKVSHRSSHEETGPHRLFTF